MPLKDTYARVRKSIVAICSNTIIREPNTDLPPIPHIIGTGYLVSADGLVATNRHVAAEVLKLADPHDPGKFGVSALLFTSRDGIRGLVELSMAVIGVVGLGIDVLDTQYGDPQGPDFAFLQIRCKEMPFLEYDSEYVPAEGDTVALAGFPMGSRALTEAGRVHYLSPTLACGVISSIHPFPCPDPIGFSVGTLTHGGSSGSPVFLPETGKVVGTLWGGQREVYGHQVIGPYLVPAGQSLIVSTRFSIDALQQVRNDPRIRPDPSAESLDELLAKWDGMMRPPGQGRWRRVEDPPAGQSPGMA